jgi:hypothetical protein
MFGRHEFSPDSQIMLKERLLNIGENSVCNLNVEVHIIIPDTQNIFNYQFSTYSLIHICMYREAVFGSGVMRYIQVSVFQLCKIR